MKDAYYRVCSALSRHAALYRSIFFIKHLPRELRSFLLPLGMAAPKQQDDARGFRGDAILRDVVRRFITELPISAIVETGTAQGDTTLFFANLRPKLIFSCEATGLYYRESRHRLQHRRNVVVECARSPEFVRKLAHAHVLGDLPFFFLDAHWFDYWPLERELQVIRELPKSIILIHDVAVPGREDFRYDSWFRNGFRLVNDLGFIMDALGEACRACRLFVPAYYHGDAFPGGVGKLRGHAFFFKNAAGEAERFGAEFGRSNYREVRVRASGLPCSGPSVPPQP